MATGNITRLEGVWPETHERAVRDSAGVNLETKLGNINSNISQLEANVGAIYGKDDAEVVQINTSSGREADPGNRIRLIIPVIIGDKITAACTLGKGVAASIYDTRAKALAGGADYLQTISYSYVASLSGVAVSNGYLAVSLCKSNSSNFSSSEVSDYINATTLAVERGLTAEIERRLLISTYEADRVNYVNRTIIDKALVAKSNGEVVINQNYTTIASPLLLLGNNDLSISKAYQSSTSSACCFYDIYLNYISYYQLQNDGEQAATIPHSSFPEKAVFARCTMKSGSVISGDDNIYTALPGLMEKLGGTADTISWLYTIVLGQTFSAEDIALGSGRTGAVSLPLYKGLKVKVTVDIEGAVSRSGAIYPGWYNGSTTNLITTPDSAKPTIDGSISHIVFYYTPDANYPNGLFALSNWSYDANNIQYATVSIEICSHELRLGALEDEFEQLSEDVDTIRGTSIFSFNPEPVVTLKLTQITRATRQSDSVVPNSLVSFLHFSDIHGQEVNLSRILAFGSKYAQYIDDIISSGDQIAVQIANSFDFWNECGAQKVLLTIGNHETWQNNGPNDESDPASAADCYAKYFGNIAQWGVTSPGANKCYYYKDYNTAGNYPLRLIVIDCMHIDTDQTTWFEGLLSEAKTNGYTVVIMSHYSPSVLSKVDFDEDSTFTCAEGPRNWAGYDTVAPFEILVDSYITAGGKFACWLCGHLHWDMFGLSEHGQPIVCIECATTVRTDRYDARVIGTKTQDSFNIVSFDTYKGIFRIARIGNDMDRYLRPKETMCYDYVNKVGIFNA